jgi:methionyl-tRNA formyltransferase
VSLAYLGTSEFAVGVLRRLADSPRRPALVVTRPDRPRGRGRKLASPPVADAARELGLPLAQPADVHELDLFEHEHVVVCAFGALLRERLLDHTGLLNVHPSLLPRWRGAAPIERAIMAGDEQTGVCIMRVVAALDAGPVCARATEAIRDDDTYATLSERLVPVAGDLLLEVLETPPQCAEQGEEGATYAEKIGPADRELDLSNPPEESLNRIRALSPHIGARAELQGRPVTIWKAKVEDGELVPVEVQPEGRRRMGYDEFLRGLR